MPPSRSTLLLRSKASPWHKAAKRKRIRRTMEPFRVHRKRIGLNAVCGDDGEPILDPILAGEAMAKAW